MDRQMIVVHVLGIAILIVAVLLALALANR